MNAKNKESGLASRLLHGAKDLIWQDESITNRATASKDVQSVRPSGDVRPSMDQGASNPMADDLMSVVMNRPTAYSSLAEAINALSDIGMDETTRYRSAFAVLKKTQQRTVDQITQAVDVHLGLLESEIVRFSGQSRNIEEEEIAARQKAIGSLNNEIELASKQILQLQEEVARKQARSSELAHEAEQKQQAILKTQKNFEEAIDIVRNKLNQEKAKIHNFLGSTLH
jgi:hypothetical protein